VRGYFNIGVYHPKTGMNIGTLWRSAYQLGAAGIFVVGKRYEKMASDTYKTPRHIPLWEYTDWDDFASHRPCGAQLIGIEMGGEQLPHFWHPQQAIYLLGAEDHGLPPDVLAQCQYVVSIPAVRQESYNVAVAGSIVMFHRSLQQQSGRGDGP